MTSPIRTLALTALLTATATVAAAQTPAAGALVRDARGETLGRIESVTTDSAGRPVQVFVRMRREADVRSTVRALPAASLRPTADGFAIPLRKAEFEVLPPVKR